MWPSKRFCLALIGLILYLLDVGSDNWVGYILIQSCHFRYGAAVFCLVWVLPGSFQFLWGIKYKDNCTNWGDFFCGLFVLAMNIMAVRVVEFSNGGTKLERLLPRDSKRSRANFKIFTLICKYLPHFLMVPIYIAK